VHVAESSFLPDLFGPALLSGCFPQSRCSVMEDRAIRVGYASPARVNAHIWPFRSILAETVGN